jgi:signal transduction histidine kinase
VALRSRRLAILVVAGAGASVLVAALAGPGLGFRAAGARVALESAAGLTALLAAYLLFGRFRESSRGDHLAAALALGVLAASSLGFTIVTATLAGSGSRSVLSISLVGHLAGAAAFAFAAWVPASAVRRPERVLVVAVGAFLPLVVAAAVLTGGLPGRVGEAVPRGGSGLLDLDDEPVVRLAVLASAALFGVAAVGFASRATRLGDEFVGWLATGTAIAAVAAVNYFLDPAFATDRISTGDLFRLLFLLVLLTAAAREIRGYWIRLAEAAVNEERRRLAREIHDGPAQELALIKRRAQRLKGDRDDPETAAIVAAAERGLDGSRRAIGLLVRPVEEPLDVALARNAAEVASAHEADLVLDLEADVDVAPSVHEALVRIVREAVANAARHAAPSTVRLELANGRRVRVCVADDGQGFEPRHTTGFGLISMRDRARLVGASLRVDSHPGRGTRVEVLVP